MLNNMFDGLRNIKLSGLGAPLLLIIMLSMIILPLPPILLDLFFKL